jgi:hypothetical protein
MAACNGNSPAIGPTDTRARSGLTIKHNNGRGRWPLAVGYSQRLCSGIRVFTPYLVLSQLHSANALWYLYVVKGVETQSN